MGTLIVRDLKIDKDLDRKAMKEVCGGRRPRRKRLTYIPILRRNKLNNF